ncbi:apolipoprotein N-acyltransferase [Candidatus Odyssella acanthamoebae]|uniref:Apolipoprotein N-acyltransferase n=1 Tax=Candidatus Odyssella acanthamoebae TaxID=91604 RepID=A0A077AZC6_9PROT|nr:apolipoprotein N-acyltransferase [Candidatus Paracaedibacter acanthamoebae]AIK97023.1 hypothetical protein ID47_10220 [Candidatus Paracaedibacter acanthamoebae]
MYGILSTLTSFAGRYPRLAIFLFGGLASLSFAPFNCFPAGIFGFSGLLYCLTYPSWSNRPYFYGWWFGFGYFTIGLYWIANGLKTAGFWYLMPLGWFGLPAFLALFIAPVVGLSCTWMRPGLARCLLFTVLWSIAEYLRGHILTGFPWNLNGYTWPLEILQVSSIIGIYGLSLLTTLLFVSLASKNRTFVAGYIILFVGLYGWGHQRLTQFPTERTGINIRLVQAAIPQQLKWVAGHFEENFNKHLGLSMMEGERPLKAIIWAEASIPTFITDYPVLMGTLAAIAPPQGYMIVGGPRHGVDNQIYTSTLVVNTQGQLIASYDKFHLVPFGEYFPLRKIFPHVSKLTHGETDYTAGLQAQTLTVEGLPPFSPLICYEAIFPGAVVATPRPDWMLNQTNDAWYGYSSGPFQHLQIVRTRAVEEGIPLVRSANNGISAVVDASGRITEQLGLDAFGFIDFDLPKALPTPTLYSQYRDLAFFILIFALGLVSFIVRRRQHA